MRAFNYWLEDEDHAYPGRVFATAMLNQTGPPKRYGR